jgi:hypothetical protein
MEYEKRIVCFFDILGFSDLVENKKMPPEAIGQLFSELDIILRDYKEGNVRIDQFSDCFVISMLSARSSPEQLRLILGVLVKLLKYKMIARGSMVYGELIHREGYIYGPALVKAVRLEKCKALFPRIILDESLDTLIIPTVGNAQISYANFFNGYLYVERDTDGMCYVDYINYMREKVEHKIAWDNLIATTRDGVKNEDQRIREKYKWLEKKIERR